VDSNAQQDQLWRHQTDTVIIAVAQVGVAQIIAHTTVAVRSSTLQSWQTRPEPGRPVTALGKLALAIFAALVCDPSGSRWP
jgi:hypothetical protein